MQLWRINVESYGDDAVKGAGGKGWYGFVRFSLWLLAVVRSLTLPLSQANSTAALYPSQTTLLSVSPTSLTSFSHVCLSLSPPSPFSPTLITLDPSLSPRLPFPLKRGLISSLARAGCAFELVLRGVTRQDESGEQPGEAGRRRRNWIAGAREVVRATEGKGVVVSSGAYRAGEMRGSEDLINLFVLFRLSPSHLLRPDRSPPLQVFPHRSTTLLRKRLPHRQPTTCRSSRSCVVLSPARPPR